MCRVIRTLGSRKLKEKDLRMVLACFSYSKHFREQLVQDGCGLNHNGTLSVPPINGYVRKLFLRFQHDTSSTSVHLSDVYINSGGG